MNTAVLQLIPLTRFLSVTSYIQSPKYPCWWTGATHDLLSVTHASRLKDRPTNLILQAAILAVSATTHICILTVATEDYMRLNAQTAQLAWPKVQLTDS